VQGYNEFSDKLLFTPGPLTTSRSVKEAMLRDLGSRDDAFIAIVRDVRRRLVALGGATEKEYSAVLMQGSGTFSLEAVLASTVPPGGKVLVAVNGAYGRRLVQIGETLRIPMLTLDFPENGPVDIAPIATALDADTSITHVSVCHCETTSGVLNPIDEIGRITRQAGRRYFVDAMSSFGAIPVDLARAGIDYLVSSSNKCIEGVPGFAFVLARRDALESTGGWARSISLDLLAQHRGLDANGQFRFTPPTHAVLAFSQALDELDAEGGVSGRAGRYADNHATLIGGMTALGFRPYLAPQHQSYIITSFYYPDNPNFDFDTFYRGLSERGFVIYPGKVGGANCFRIGSIGRIYPDDIRRLVAAIRDVLSQMNVAAGSPAGAIG
jgi:2-aminoethylphosphonate-pyruvate transaminase